MNAEVNRIIKAMSFNSYDALFHDVSVNKAKILLSNGACRQIAQIKKPVYANLGLFLGVIPSAIITIILSIHAAEYLLLLLILLEVTFPHLTYLTKGFKLKTDWIAVVLILCGVLIDEFPLFLTIISASWLLCSLFVSWWGNALYKIAIEVLKHNTDAFEWAFNSHNMLIIDSYGNKYNKLNLRIDHDPYDKLLRIIEIGMGEKDINTTITKFYNFYTQKGIELPIELSFISDTLTEKQKRENLLKILEIGIGVSGIDQVQNSLLRFYQSNGISFPDDIIQTNDARSISYGRKYERPVNPQQDCSLHEYNEVKEESHMKETIYRWITSAVTVLFSIVCVFCSAGIVSALNEDFSSGYSSFTGALILSCICAVVHMIFFFRERPIHPRLTFWLSFFLMIASFLSSGFFMSCAQYEHRVSFDDAEPYVYIGFFMAFCAFISYLVYNILSIGKLFSLKDSGQYFDLVTENYSRGTKWLRFNASWRLPVSGIYNALYTLAIIGNIIGDFPDIDLYVFVYLICSVLLALLCLLAISPTRWLEPVAFKLNIASCICMILTTFLTAQEWGQIIAIIIFGTCEIIYFVKRKDLFYNSQELFQEIINALKEEENQEDEGDLVADTNLQYSLSPESEQPQNYSSHGIYGKDILLETAPTTETLPTTETTPDVETVPSAEAEETSELSQIEMDIEAREKAYAKIAKFHEYYEKGIITEEEYNESRQRVLDALKIETK